MCGRGSCQLVHPAKPDELTGTSVPFVDLTYYLTQESAIITIDPIAFDDSYGGLAVKQAPVYPTVCC